MGWLVGVWLQVDGLEKFRWGLLDKHAIKFNHDFMNTFNVF